MSFRDRSRLASFHLLHVFMLRQDKLTSCWLKLRPIISYNSRIFLLKISNYSLMNLVVFLLHSTACHWTRILKWDKRQFAIHKKTKNKNMQSLSVQSFSLKWKYILYQTLQGLFTLTSAVPAIYNNVPVITLIFHLVSSCFVSLCVNNADAMNKTCLEK